MMRRTTWTPGASRSTARLWILIGPGAVRLWTLMVFSASMSEEQRSPRYYFSHQLQWFLVGLVAMARRLPDRLPRAGGDWLTWSSLHCPGAAAHVLHRRRVRRRSAASSAIGPFQPSEIAKLAVILFCAEWLPRKGDDVRTWNYGLRAVWRDDRTHCRPDLPPA